MESLKFIWYQEVGVFGWFWFGLIFLFLFLFFILEELFLYLGV